MVMRSAWRVVCYHTKGFQKTESFATRASSRSCCYCWNYRVHSVDVGTSAVAMLPQFVPLIAPRQKVFVGDRYCTVPFCRCLEYIFSHTQCLCFEQLDCQYVGHHVAEISSSQPRGPRKFKILDRTGRYRAVAC